LLDKRLPNRRRQTYRPRQHRTRPAPPRTLPLARSRRRLPVAAGGQPWRFGPGSLFP
jgi:hypothetical protein